MRGGAGVGDRHEEELLNMRHSTIYNSSPSTLVHPAVVLHQFVLHLFALKPLAN
jgi:hypothetical protein